ncbi:lysine exporter LysO family protein [Marinomonas ostreistagni]|uniref:Lysine exporter LysO family protein n=1 Tax=Marinomonas ostreistagni TaxID=359209 RepID=A0ABS0ZD36_9GAMM|nr:lysine exporter LysO family protein [Marinomonas ostreistagni]MBJ7551545.1 lysine exporter LysO family protein [Marinomonas ostreistagni]
MTILSTLGPLLAALLFGYWVKVPLATPERVAKGLSQLTYLILGLIGYSIGALDNLASKVAIAGYQAVVFFFAITVLPLLALWISGQVFHAGASKVMHVDNNSSTKHALVDAAKTLSWVLGGVLVGWLLKSWIPSVDELVTWLLYLLLFLVGCQLRQGNFRLRKLFLNTQGVAIACTTVFVTLLAGLIAGSLIGLEWNKSLAVVSGFGWYSLSGILITGLGDPVLGTTAFLLDLGREIIALMLIPALARINSHLSVGISGATAMDFTLPLLGKVHGAEIVPVCIASGFIMSFLVPVLIPLFMGM